MRGARWWVEIGFEVRVSRTGLIRLYILVLAGPNARIPVHGVLVLLGDFELGWYGLL